jgi:hypothetical protein
MSAGFGPEPTYHLVGRVFGFGGKAATAAASRGGS